MDRTKEPIPESQRNRRPVVLSKILARRKRRAIAVASPLDFILQQAGELHPERDKWPGPAYCLSRAEKRVLFTICPHTDALFDAPFLWQAQYQLASQVASVPFERLQEFIGTLPLKPIFVFSIGRCGSTLLSALLRKCGIHSISEPDLLTQLATSAFGDRSRMGTELRQLLVQSCIASLAHHGTVPIAIKLRSQCNVIAREIAQAFPEGTYVMMMRERHAWLNSRLTALGGDPVALASLYRSGLEAYHELQSLEANCKMVWYEDLLNRPEATLAQLVRNTSIGPRGIPDVRSVMDRDSQSGTTLEKNTFRRRRPTPEQLRKFDHEWERIRPDSWIEAYALDRLRSGS